MERPRTKKSLPPGTALLTPRQVIVLLVLSALGLIILGLVAARLVFSSARLATVEQAAAVPTLPPVDSPALQAPTSNAALAPGSVLPAGCEQTSGSLIESPGAAVLDSQTIEISIGQAPVRVRLAGIALLGDQPAAGAAVTEIQSLIDGQPVVLALVEGTTNADGSRPAYLYSNGWFLNHELILRGIARVDPSAPGQACAELFQQAEQQARAARAGLWMPTRVPTATFVPTVGFDPALQAPCDCMARPVCGDFSSHDQAQACYNACNDYNSRLDDDRDGLACEWLP